MLWDLTRRTRFAEVYRAIGNDLQAVLTALPADVLARTIRT